MPNNGDSNTFTSPPPPATSPELLAPAGDRECLEAALDAGANAVYFGLTALNARRRATNFHSEEFAAVVEAVHARRARAYLALNIDLAERELGQAARMLELARQSGVDAVLVRDPALLALRPEYPEIEFHFSTQTCMANSADVAAAGKLGASRVVLAREMSLWEIRAAAAVPGVQTEVFVQGALCFSISGRCLLSSWVGGRSGNRGACTSPCRVPWTGVADGPAAYAGETPAPQPLCTPLSMRDLTAIERLDELRQAGVAGLKIEGRLKNAAWVRRAVGLYRRALDGEDVARLLPDVAELGAYTGRMLTCGYLDGRRDELTGLAAREPSPGPQSQEVENADDADRDRYDLEIMVTDREIACRCHCGGRDFPWSMPKTVIHRPQKAVAVGEVFARLAGQEIQGCRLDQATTNDDEFLLVRRAAAALIERVSASLRQARKSPDDQVRIELPATVRELLENREPSSANVRTLGEQPDRVRLDVAAVGTFLQQARPEGVIVEGATAARIEKTLAACNGVPLVVALPPVFFEDEIAGVRQLLQQCAHARATVEVNSWGGWQLARKAGVRMESGPGLPVLNSLAASMLGGLGMRCVALSPEADRKQLEQLTAHCPAACSLIVYGRPALLTTRVRLREEELLGKVLADRRGARLVPRLERKLWVFRPVEPFDLRACRNERIRVKHLVVDLVGSADPVGEWFDAPSSKSECFQFNYDRALT